MKNFQNVCGVSEYSDDLTVGAIICNVNVALHLCDVIHCDRLGVGIQCDTY